MGLMKQAWTMVNLAKHQNTCSWTNTEKVFIVDFETSSIERRVSNVTAVCQYLFAGNSSASKILAEVFGQKDRLGLIDVMRAYKKNRTRRNFERLLKFCLS